MRKSYNLILSLLTLFAGVGSALGQVSKTNNSPLYLNGNINTHIINFTAGDFGGCTSLTDVNISLNWQGDPFPVAEEIAVSLQSPSGTTVHLVKDVPHILTGVFQQPTYSSSFISWTPLTTTFDDEGPAAIPASATVPESGSYIPSELLGAFDGENPVGNWTVTYSDATNHNFGPGFGDGFTVNSSSISISCGAPATPPSISLTDTTLILCNGASTGALTATVTGGTANYDYAWSNGSSTTNTSSLTNGISSLSAGYYKVVVTDDNGLKDSTDITLAEPSALNASAISDSNITCNGASDGGATASATGGTGAYSYLWSNGATTASITGVTAGTYKVYITDVNSCIDSASVTITEPAVLIASAIIDSNASCNGGLDGGATASATGGDNSYDYLWSNGATTASITGVAAGTYKVYISDHNECLDSASVTIIEFSTLASSVAIDSNVTCNGATDGGATITPTGGTPPYTYAWSNSATTASITGVAAGKYTVTVSDNNGCTHLDSVTITEPAVLIASAVVDSNITCNGASDGGATASATGGDNSYDYLWSNGATTASITGVPAGIYKVYISDHNECLDSASVTITEPAVLIASAVVDSNITCNGASDGGATASATGGDNSYDYLWSNGATTASITGVPAGIYKVYISDHNECLDSASVTITEPAVLIASAVVDSNITCNGASDGGATASATGGDNSYDYLWSNGATTASITGVPAGTYKVYISDHNECLDSASVTITEPAVLIASAVVDSNITCNGASDGGATAFATGGDNSYDYLWSNGATTASITGVPAGIYKVYISDHNECLDSASVTITEPAVLIASAVVDSNITCNGASDGGATASATGGDNSYDYLWSNGATTASITGVPAGIYKVYISDHNECLDSASVTITEPAVLIASAVVDSNITCNGASDGGATASATGGDNSYDYLWSNGATTASITGVPAGTYKVYISDHNECLDSASVTITEPAVLIASAVVDSNITCNGASDGGATASATGGDNSYDYLWSNGATTASITGVPAGTYKVYISDHNECLDSASVTITEPTVLIASTVVDSNTTCNGYSNGGGTVSATGGTAPYTYLWSNAATTASITGVVAGKYMVYITDNNGCTTMDSVIITEPAVLTAMAVADSNISCNGYSDGGASASATGGTAPYTYLWSNGATTASITGVPANTYTVYITDNNGCTAMNNVNITEPAILASLTVADSNISCNGYSDGGASASATGGTAPYTYLWSNAATTASITGVVAGKYMVYITDNNGCTTMDSVTITEPAILTAMAVADSNISCNGYSDGGATASVSGGTTPYTYLWSNGATTASITGVPANTYTVYITDNNGCTAMNNVTITEPSVLAAMTVVDSNATCYGYSNGGGTVSATGGTAPYTYLWSNAATTASITGVVAGKYMVYITDNNGCTTMDSITITEPAEIVSTDIIKATDTYDWIDGNTYTESIYGPTHTLTAASGCDSIVTLDLTIINYCASRSTRNRFEWIKQVKLEDDINNTSGANSGGFGNYSDQVLEVDTNDVVTVELTPGYKRKAYDEYWRIWADWNYDGDFNDPGEKVFEQHGKNLRTGSFNIPTNVDSHQVGLRVSMRWKRYAAPCGNFRSGEVEDYSIKVNGAQGYINIAPTRTTLDEDVADYGNIYEFIDLYPNPVLQGDYVTGFIRVEETGIKNIQIVNTLGQIVKSTEIDCNEEESRFEISTQGLSKGLYFVNIDSGLETIKIIVQ